MRGEYGGAHFRAGVRFAPKNVIALKPLNAMAKPRLPAIETLQFLNLVFCERYLQHTSLLELRIYARLG